MGLQVKLIDIESSALTLSMIFFLNIYKLSKLTASEELSDL